MITFFLINRKQYLFLILAMCLLNATFSFGQSCYSDTRKEAINTFSKKDFKRAKQVFLAAKSCPDKPQSNDLNFWIKKCDNAVGSNAAAKTTALTFAQKMALYESEGDWSEGLMPVTRKSENSKHENDNNYTPKVGFVNEKGDLVIECKYVHSAWVPMTFFSHVNIFKEGLAAVTQYFPDGHGDYYYAVGYIDKVGKTVLPFNYSFATVFSEGIAAVSEDDFYENPTIYFIDKKGNRIGDRKYYLTQCFHDGMCAVMTDSTSGWGFADKTGKLVVPCDYEEVNDFKDGVASVMDKAHKQNYEYALIDKAGSMVGGYQFRPECLKWWDLVNCINKSNGKDDQRFFFSLKEYERRKKEQNDGTWELNSNDAIYMCELGTCYKEGKGGAVKDVNIAIEYWKKAAPYHPHSLFNLAFTYSELKNYQQSREYYLKLIEEQTKLNKTDYLASAYYNMGIQYYNGQGVTADFKIALDYFQKAKNAGGKSNCDDMIRKCKEKIGN